MQVKVKGQIPQHSINWTHYNFHFKNLMIDRRSIVKRFKDMSKPCNNGTLCLQHNNINLMSLRVHRLGKNKTEHFVVNAYQLHVDKQVDQFQHSTNLFQHLKSPNYPIYLCLLLKTVLLRIHWLPLIT